MPYIVEETKNGYVIKKKDTGKVVARPKNLMGVRGYIWHAENAQKKAGRGVMVPGRLR